MLWYRFWLETRNKVTFVVAWSVFFFALGLYPVASRSGATTDQIVRVFLTQTTFIALLAAGMLAGSGVRTQTFGRAYRGLHGSVHFTLSLPITRTRLLLTRTALGLAETILVVLLVSVAGWALLGSMRLQAGVGDVIVHALFIATASIGVAGMAVLSSTVFDDVVQTWVVAGTTMLLFVFQQKLPRPVNLIGAMTEGSPLLTGTVPWAGVLGSIAAGALFVAAAARVVRNQEF